MLTLTITTPERHVVGPVKIASITLPGEKGEMTVLPGHARLVTLLGIGILAFEADQKPKEIAAVAGGFAHIHNDQVTVLADRLELAKEINLERARRAQIKAEEMLKAKENFEEDMTKWRLKLQRASIRQEAAQYLLPPH